MKSAAYLKDLNNLRSRAVTKRATQGERIFGSLFPNRGTGWPGGWSQDRMEQVMHLRDWCYVAINAICSKVAAITPNIAYVVDSPTNKSTKACQRGLLNILGRGFGGHGYSGGETKAISSVSNPKSSYAYGEYMGLSPDNVSLLSSGGGHSFLTIGEYRSKALSVVKPHEELEPVELDHQLRRLLDNPNKYDTSFDLMYELQMFDELCGIDYLWAIPNRWGVPCELWVIPSHWVWPRTGGGKYIDIAHQHADELIQYYEIRPWGGMGSAGILEVPPNEIIMQRWKSPINKIDGYSRLAAGAQWIDSEESITKSRWSQFQNQARPEFWVELGPGYEDPDDDRISRLEAKFAAKIQGEYNYGKPVITPPGAKITPLSFNPTEMAYFQCCVEDMECLTDEGWKKYDELTIDSRIACFDDKTQTLQYHTPSQVYVKDYEGPVYKWSGRGLDSMVTPNHRIYTKEYGKDDWKVTRVQNLPPLRQHHIRTTAPVVCDTPDTVEVVKYKKWTKSNAKRTSHKIKTELWAEFLGWYVSEGHCARTRSRVSISQGILSEHTPRIQGMLNELPFGQWYKQTCGGKDNKGCYQWGITDRGLYEHLKENCGIGAREKRLPRYVKGWSAAALSVLLRAAINGDGRGPRTDKYGYKHWEYRTVSGRLAEDMAEIGVKCGLRSSIVKSNYEYKGELVDYFTVHFCDRVERTLDPDHRTVVQYKGKIWCVTVPTGLFVVRRNGCVHVTGNSEEQIRDMILSLFGVPKAAVGVSNDMTYGSLLASLASFCAQCLNTRLMMRGLTLTKQLGSRWDEPARSWSRGDGQFGGNGTARKVRIWWDDVVPADPQQVNSDIGVDAQNYAITPNEVRALRGRKPYRHGGDDPLVQGAGGVMPLPMNSGEDQSEVAALIAEWTKTSQPPQPEQGGGLAAMMGGGTEGGGEQQPTEEGNPTPTGESTGENEEGEEGAEAETPEEMTFDEALGGSAQGEGNESGSAQGQDTFENALNTNLAEDAGGIKEPNRKPKVDKTKSIVRKSFDFHTALRMADAGDIIPLQDYLTDALYEWGYKGQETNEYISQRWARDITQQNAVPTLLSFVSQFRDKRDLFGKSLSIPFLQEKVFAADDDPVKIKLPDLRQGTPYSCGASCVMSVCEYFGVGPQTEKEYMDVLHSDPEMGTNPRHLVHFLHEVGLDVHARNGMSLDDLHSEVDQGKPTIVLIQAWEDNEREDILETRDDNGHYVVVTGYDQGNVYFEDPVLKGFRAVIPNDEFMSRWHDVDGQGQRYVRWGVTCYRNHPIERIKSVRKAEPSRDEVGTSRYVTVDQSTDDWNWYIHPGFGSVNQFDPVGPFDNREDAEFEAARRGWKVRKSVTKAQPSADEISRSRPGTMVWIEYGGGEIGWEVIDAETGEVYWEDFGTEAEAEAWATRHNFKIRKGVTPDHVLDDLLRQCEQALGLSYNSLRQTGGKRVINNSPLPTEDVIQWLRGKGVEFVSEEGDNLVVKGRPSRDETQNREYVWIVNYGDRWRVEGPPHMDVNSGYFPTEEEAEQWCNRHGLKVMKSLTKAQPSADEWRRNDYADIVQNSEGFILYEPLPIGFESVGLFPTREEAELEASRRGWKVRKENGKCAFRAGMRVRDTQDGRTGTVMEVNGPYRSGRCSYRIQWDGGARSEIWEQELESISKGWKPVSMTVVSQWEDEPVVMMMEAENPLQEKPPEPKKSKFSSTQFNLSDGVPNAQHVTVTNGNTPRKGNVIAKIEALRDAIADEDVDEEEGKEHTLHITVRYGLHTEDSTEVEALVAGFGPVTVSFGKTSLFVKDENEVVKIEVEGESLRKLNALLAQLPNTDKYETYNPHVTLAYVKPGRGQWYIDNDAVNGYEMTFDTLIFSDKERNHKKIKLVKETVEKQTKSLDAGYWISPSGEATSINSGGIDEHGAALLRIAPHYRGQELFFYKAMAEGWIRVRGDRAQVIGWGYSKRRNLSNFLESKGNFGEFGVEFCDERGNQTGYKHFSYEQFKENDFTVPF